MEEESKSLAETAINLIQKKCGFFHDQYGTPYAVIKKFTHRENYPLNSRAFRNWVQGSVYEETGKPLSSNTLQAVMAVFETKATHEGYQLTLHNRVCFHEGALWYDLSNEEWSAVRITEDGWSIENNPPTLFKRYAHQKPQVIPEEVGGIDDLDDFINIKDPTKKYLFKVALISCFIPDCPHVIIVPYGQQGSAKSTCIKLAREIVDPSRTQTLSLPKNKNELIQQLSHNWFAAYDNISYLNSSISDVLARAISGEGQSKRQLFRDDDDIIYEYKRCVSLNGINAVPTKPDLIDRSLFIELERISRENRKTEARLFRDFRKKQPAILGGIFDILSDTLRIKPEVKLKELPRMADFAEWGEAISRAMGYDPLDFQKAYFDSIDIQNVEALHANIIGDIMLELMNETDKWEGTPTELYERCFEIAERLKINTNQKAFPKSPKWLTHRLNEIKTNLNEVGVEYETGHDGLQRYIKITKNSVSNVNIVKTTKRTQNLPNDTNAINDNGKSSAFSLPKKAQNIKPEVKFFGEDW